MSTPLQPQLAIRAFRTELGWCSVAWRQERIRRLQIGFDSKEEIGPCWQADRLPERRRTAECAIRTSDVPGYVQEVIERVQRYARGTPTGFDDIALEFDSLSDFQVRVLRACRRIGWGQRVTYGDLAAQIGRPRAARAVGSALARNPFPIIIPCHRVVAAGREQWGGFSAPGGITLKRRMLTLECCETVE